MEAFGTRLLLKGTDNSGAIRAQSKRGRASWIEAARRASRLRYTTKSLPYQLRAPLEAWPLLASHNGRIKIHKKYTTCDIRVILPFSASTEQ